MSLTDRAISLLAAVSAPVAAADAPAAAQSHHAQSASGELIEGHWVNPAGSVVIAVAPCGEHLCGTVEWASEKAKEDARKGTEQLIGAQLLSKVRPANASRWEGRLFVPDVDRHVHAKIELVDSNRLKVSGCAIGKSLCKSQVWTRSGH